MFFNHAHIMPREIRADGGMEPFLKTINSLGLEGAVCFAPFSYQVVSLGLNPNRWLQQQIAGEHSLVGYGTLAPDQPPQEQVQEIVELGFKGVKLHPAAQGFDVAGNWAMEAYGCLVEHGLIADFHTGIHQHRLREYQPLIFDEIAFHYPDLKMVFEHVGGWHFFKEMVAVIGNNQHKGNHLCAGIASVLDPVRQSQWHLGVEGLKDIKWQVGADLMVYGMDYPYNQEENIKRDIELIRNSGLPAKDVEGILGSNLTRLLGKA